MEQEEKKTKGKGKRGGNSPHSLVIHSGKKRESHAPVPAHLKSRGYEKATGHRWQDKTRTNVPAKKIAPWGSVLNRAYTVKVDENTDYGAFVIAPRELLQTAYFNKGGSQRVLLPFSEQKDSPREGSLINVRFYEDKGGRLACTMREPILKEGEIGILKVVDSTRIGVFLDNGMPKELLLPFREQITTPGIGDDVLVWLYTDKSGRPAATMRIYGHLDTHSPYKEDTNVSGFVYEINPKLGIFVAVDNKYYGMIPISESFRTYSYGDIIEARVSRVRPDGKLDLLEREKLYKSTQQDAEIILARLKENNGFLPYGDRADAAFIKESFNMSKNQFKRALGHLFKNHLVELDREHDTVRLL